MSTSILSFSEIKVLSKGLNFCPTNKFNLYNTILDVNKFSRNLTLRKHFCNLPTKGMSNNSDSSGRQVPPVFLSFPDQTSLHNLQLLQQDTTAMVTKPKIYTIPGNKDFYPFQSRPSTLDQFQDLVEQELIQLHKDVPQQDRRNMSQHEHAALRNLSQRKDITIRSADKGGAVIILDSGLYDLLNKDMLKDQDTYRSLAQNPTNAFQSSLSKLLADGLELGAISETDMEKLSIPYPITPIFHSLPKIHKGVFPPPLRPIVAGIGSMGERLSAWVDSHLQPLVSITPSYIKDTKNLVSIMDGQTWASHYSWVSLDVAALYPSIRHATVINNLQQFLATYSAYTPPLREFLLLATEWLLAHNFFFLQ